MQKEKNFYRHIFAIAIPIALQNFISFAVNMMDTVMLGKADGTGIFLSAASLGNQPFFILSMIAFGLAGAATVLSAQYWGKQEVKTIRIIFSIVLKLCFVASVVFGVAVIAFPEQIMKLYSSSPEIIAAGADYLRIVGIAYIFSGISITMICSLRCVELVKISVVVNLISFFTNVFLNYCLIFGNLGFPRLGIKGAAIATVIARIVEFIIVFIYVLFIDKRLKFRFKDIFLFNKEIAKDLFKFGGPVFANEVLWSLGTTVQAAILGHITYANGDPVAANSIASTVMQFATIIIFGVANAAAVVVGKAIGENDIEKAKRSAKRIRIMSLIVGFVAMCTIFLLKPLALSFYDVPETTRALASDFLTVTAFIVFFISFSATSIMGILRGAGDTRFCLWAEMGALWVAATPLAFIAAYVLQLPVVLVLILMRIDEPLKSLICFIRMKGNKWIKSVTREIS